MPKQRHPTRDRTIGLTDEDARLWSRVTETARPLKRGRDRIVAAQTDASEGDGPRKPEAKRPSSAVPAGKPRPLDRRSRGEPAATTPQIATIGRREQRQLAKGRLAVDARLDLHGLRQDEAHRALEAFLAGAHARGHRHVLVVTGKGGATRDEEPGPFYERRDRGVLKRLVPHWLSEPAFRQLVLGFGPAHARHGGEGALYVRLRRRTRG